MGVLVCPCECLCVRETVMRRVVQGEFDLMRTGDTASYLLHDFFLLVFSSCFSSCVEIIIYNFI